MMSRLKGKSELLCKYCNAKKQRHVLYNLDEVLSLHFSNTV